MKSWNLLPGNSGRVWVLFATPPPVQGLGHRRQPGAQLGRVAWENWETSRQTARRDLESIKQPPVLGQGVGTPIRNY